MRILVTGGAGFIGSHIVDSLVARGDQVLVVDDLSTGKAANLPPAAELCRLDICSERLIEVARAWKPEAITHCAAQASVVVSMASPAFDATTNILGGLNVVKAALSSSCGQLVYLNTGGALYGPPDYLPCDEQHPVRPISAYGLSKWTLERYLEMLVPAAVPLKVLRLANIFGPRQDPSGEAGVISIFADRMARGEPVTIFGDGEQTRDFVYVADVVRAHELALQAAGSFTANISSASGLSVNQIFRLLAEESGYQHSPIYAARRSGEMQHSVLCNTKAKELLGWAPQIQLEVGLRATLEWVRSALQPASIGNVVSAACGHGKD